MTNTVLEQSIEGTDETRQAKNERIAFRTTTRFRQQLDRAVALSGRSRTDFITAALADKVEDELRHHHYLELSEWDMKALLDAIENPPPPNEAMLRGIDRWRKHFHPSK
ncbi:MAG: DUF1778 domain-containing protein [Chloroflexia bacterium]|nr:DUF1778 domain-containing protein [Chloroflexia bacterium]MDQ3413320.1 DUF1778 domain-containing protein [Chloroflexota bacterium]